MGENGVALSILVRSATESRYIRGMTKTIDIDRVARLIIDVAAEEIVPRYKTLGADAIRSKTSANDMVTDADEQAEAQLTCRLPDLLPGSVVVGEEAVYANPAVLDRLSGDQPVWVVDPVDGTANFARGHPAFACMVALVEHGQTVAGWIWDPIGDRLWIAEQGAGACCNGRRIQVSGHGQPLSSLIGSLGRGRLANRLEEQYALRVRHGSAAHDYAAMADGRVHFAVYNRLKPWDHAAGVLLHHEAGGYSALRGQNAPYQPTRQDGELIVAPDREIWERINDLLPG
ncbi:fructose-1,6-bisphosphatase [Insolitispirillum peregrinum]|uniref:Fructose-1,6-bisphosphatase n=2 Tax=Insolitispirillum peregrinum TaxID=80876 RepID=A0A1N7IMN6_9PROT|nr:fructose-1,6-bisphosphatase [Insolitispirillum peregrinum]